MHQLSSQSCFKSFKADLVSRLKQTVMEVNETDSLMTISAGSTRQLGKDTESEFI